MFYNRRTDFYNFGNNTYLFRINPRSNLGHIFREEISPYGPGNTVHKNDGTACVEKVNI